MFRIKIRTVALALILTLFLGKVGSYSFSKTDELNFLIVGVDNAFENTDVISVVRLDSNEGKASFLQIPRDTYCSLDVYQNKINHIFSSARAEGADRVEAITRLRSFLSDELSLRLDGHILVDAESFFKLVSSIGGVNITIPEDMTLYNGDEAVLSLHKGENHLDPESAMIFVRHRSGYSRGDLERLEMQRIFLSGLFGTLVNNLGFTDALRIASVLKDCETDISTKSLLSIFSKRKAFSCSSPEGAILPGEAIKGNSGVWYYALNKRGCDEILERMFKVDYGSFDLNKLFLNDSDVNFKDIYYK